MFSKDKLDASGDASWRRREQVRKRREFFLQALFVLALLFVEIEQDLVKSLLQDGLRLWQVCHECIDDRDIYGNAV